MPLLPPPDPSMVPPGGSAFLFDLDGTLLELAALPDDVTVPAGLLPALKRLQVLTNGAVAVVSGRRVAFLDQLLPGLASPLAGVHGLELRLGTEGDERRTIVEAVGAHGLTELREVLGPWLRAHPSVTVEDKGLAIALHFRADPALQPEVEAFAERFAARPDQGLHIQRGKMVLEIRALGPHKGDAVRTIMALPAFQARRPVYFGDDVTDEDAFAAVAELGGLGVFVGEQTRPTLAGAVLASPGEVQRFIARLGRETQAGTAPGMESM